MARRHEDWFTWHDMRRAQDNHKEAGETRVLRLAALVILLGRLLRDTEPPIPALSSGFLTPVTSHLTLTLL